MKYYEKIFFCTFFVFMLAADVIGQLAWPTISSLNQINCTYAEIHSAFHRALEINTPNSSLIFAAHDGKVLDTARGNTIYLHH